MRIGPTPFRFWFAITALGGFAAIVTSFAFRAEVSGIGFRLLFLVVGLGAAAMTYRIWSGGRNAIVLTREWLCDTRGTVIARIADIENVDRGFVMFKPSNGFVLKLRAPGPRAWEPGLWWRLGRRVGVGGTIPNAAGRNMADIIKSLLAERDDTAF